MGTRELSWATTIESVPDPATVPDDGVRSNIAETVAETGFPWRIRTHQDRIEMVLIPAGGFDIGANFTREYEHGNHKSAPYHVYAGPPFYLARYPVTQKQWMDAEVSEFMGGNPSLFQDASDDVPVDDVLLRPVERVSWTMARDFASACGLRLPNVAEWEWVFRAGFPRQGEQGTHREILEQSLEEQAAFFGRFLWHRGNAGGQTRPVGRLRPNLFGVYDIGGNVREWVDEIYRTTCVIRPLIGSPRSPVEARVWYSDTVRLACGGSWSAPPASPLAFERNYLSDEGTAVTGFRLASVCEF
jgi:formylglycine-generating enzyme required for sulfatase activity